ncbi:MAG: hypothetical protein JWP75_3388 [Frondihabitans sp.]|nr:hypothetical protein [Frondihabitans sp.]
MLRRAGFVRLAKDGPSRWYVLDEDWLALIDEATRSLAERWKEHIDDRSVGVNVELFLHRRDDVDARGEPKRGHRGRSSRNVAARGIGRSSSVEGADGGDGFE